MKEDCLCVDGEIRVVLLSLPSPCPSIILSAFAYLHTKVGKAHYEAWGFTFALLLAFVFSLSSQ